MPYIGIKVSEKLTAEKKNELKAAMGKAIETIPGKTETYLMVAIEDNTSLWLAGVKGDENNPMAFVDARILGKAKREDFSRLTAEICKVLDVLIGIKPTNVYVTYSEVEHWGHNGRNF